jgi:amidase
MSYLDFNGRPFGLVALATAGQEEMLLKVAGAWQATFPARSPPPMLMGDSKGPLGSLL